MLKQYAYNFIKQDPEFLNGNPDIATFYNAANAATSPYRKMYDIHTAIGNGEVAIAQTLTNAFAPTNIAETNTKNYFTLAIKYNTMGTLTETEKSQLLYIANECPHTDGAWVYDARALYNKINMETGNTYYPFYDDCNISGLYKKPIVQKQTCFDVVIYPNPSREGFYLNSTTDMDKQLNITIFDVVGKIVGKKDISMVNKIGYVGNNLIPGIYTVVIENKIHEKATKKITIQ
jgi:Secretion system C-terminal sorting domain